MSIIINEEKMIGDNIFKYEEKIKSPVSRFLDSTPTYVTYFHINNDESTADDGFQDIASIIGNRSPLKYKKIDNFPLYGIDQMVLQLQEDDAGLDTSLEGEALLLPNTIKPLENDFFIIPYLHDAFIFRVTAILYDTIMPDNYYKINYTLECINEDKKTQLNNQVQEEYTCILDNIGTENNCFIENTDYLKINEIEKMYSDMVDMYLTLFYNETHNCLLGEYKNNMRFLYDPYQTIFINKHKLFTKKKDFKTIILTDQIVDKKKKIKYEKSVYRFLERRDLSLLNTFDYVTITGMSFVESTFYRWAAKDIDVLEIPINENAMTTDRDSIFSNEFTMSVKTNGFTKSIYADLIQRFVRKEELTPSDIRLDLNDELIHLNNDLELFFLTPMILYIIKEVINERIKKKER